jgi:hypothetical protein
MNFLKYETIKKKAILELRSRHDDAAMMMPVIFEALLPAVANRQDPRQVSAEWMAAAVKIIERWDVRCVAKLIELFPSCIPRHLHGKAISATLDDTEMSDWIIRFDTLDAAPR